MSEQNGGLCFSEEVDEIAPAFVEVQKEVKDPPRSGENPHFQSSYVTLEDLVHAVRPTLSDNGLTMIQAPGMEGGAVTVETMLLHESGQWVRSTARTPTDRNDPQGIGSAVTYLRRYSLAAMLGLAHEDDDDGTRASKQNGGDGSSQSTSDSDTDLTCPDCGGPCWDNTDDEKAAANGGKRPNFKCQNTDECDWASWDSREEVYGSDDVPLWKQPETVQARNRLYTELLNWTSESRAKMVWRAYAKMSDDYPSDVKEWLPTDYERAEEKWSEEGKELLMETEEWIDANAQGEMLEGADE